MLEASAYGQPHNTAHRRQQMLRSREEEAHGKHFAGEDGPRCLQSKQPNPAKEKKMSTISKRHARACVCVSVCGHVCVNTDSIVWISVDEDKEQQPLQGLKGHEAAVCVFTLAIASPQEITHSLGKKRRIENRKKLDTCRQTNKGTNKQTNKQTTKRAWRLRRMVTICWHSSRDRASSRARIFTQASYASMTAWAAATLRAAAPDLERKHTHVQVQAQGTAQTTQSATASVIGAASHKQTTDTAQKHRSTEAQKHRSTEAHTHTYTHIHTHIHIHTHTHTNKHT